MIIDRALASRAVGASLHDADPRDGSSAEMRVLMAMRMGNKRKAPRQARRLAVCLADGHRGVTRDVSPGGLCVLLAVPLSKGARVRGSIVLEGEAFPFAGVVAWQEKARNGNPAYVGIRFTGVSSLFLAKLQRTFTPASLPRVLAH